MPDVSLCRIVVASPGGVQAERDALAAVVDELNHGLCQKCGVRLNLVRWETDASPGFHPEGPQGLIDPILHIADCDLLVGIFWKRFGTPTHDAQSGTEHEFLTAYRAWQQHGRPQITVHAHAVAPAQPGDAARQRYLIHLRRFCPALPLASLGADPGTDFVMACSAKAP